MTAEKGDTRMETNPTLEQLLTQEATRVVSTLQTLAPNTDEYAKVLQNLDFFLSWLNEDVRTAPIQKPQIAQPFTQLEEPASERLSFDSPELDTPDPGPLPPTIPEISIEEARARLATLAQKGVDSAEMLAVTGAPKLSVLYKDHPEKVALLLNAILEAEAKYA